MKAFRPIGRFAHDLLQVARRDQCQGCHQTPLDALHQGSPRACGQCHSQDAWTPATFDHAPLFSLTGDHAAPCNSCHVGKDYRTYTCYGCHEHARSKIREKHVEEGIRDYEDCVKCHRSSEDKQRHHDQDRETSDGDGEAQGDSEDEGDAHQHSRKEHD